jgi:hypothetical protein
MVCLKSADILEENMASIFRVHEWAKRETSLKLVASFLDLLFKTEARGNLFLREIGWFWTDYTTKNSSLHIPSNSFFTTRPIVLLFKI